VNSRPGPETPAERIRIAVRGAVQGVGFRPFVYRLATELRLAGWVSNSSQGVLIEVEGPAPCTEVFQRRLTSEKPLRSSIHGLETTRLDLAGYAGFEIRPSQDAGPKTSLIMADIATCQECWSEIFDSANRRYFYPFTNCTNCGPRFSIIKALPYDRSNTSMQGFTMCPACQAEYEDPLNRRFHAQPNACPSCGPRLQLWGPDGSDLEQGNIATAFPAQSPLTHPLPSSRQVLDQAAEAIRAGRIVAVKGLGGFHLLARADAAETVQELRRRKHREEKPFAVMFNSLETLRANCEVSEPEERQLLSPEAPIVLLRRLENNDSQVCSAVAPGNPQIGAILPYTPLHHLLLSQLGLPVVATSGNLSDEPICTDEHEALERLRGIADFFLVHNRPIVRHVDDSVVRVIGGREMVLRRARGFAPMPLELPKLANKPATSQPVLSLGAHLKNAIALGIGPQIFISQHIGDLETEPARTAMARVAEDLQRLHEVRAEVVATDLHPDYFSTRFGEESGIPCARVQHHVAHVLSCMAENDLEPPVLGVSWDGTGYGLDGTIWGGEFFHIHDQGFVRRAHFRGFGLPGAEQAVREPRRSGLGLLFEAYGESAFDPSAGSATVHSFSDLELNGIRRMLQQKLNTPVTSSVGRLFDAIASLAGVRQRANFEGQAAMELEFLLDLAAKEDAYSFGVGHRNESIIVDWQPCLEQVLQDLRCRVAPGVISARFHNGLVEAIVAVARQTALKKVILSGGCFQNRYLTERTIERLRQSGFRPYWHQRVPPNDGGICLGQVVAARWWTV